MYSLCEWPKSRVLLGFPGLCESTGLVARTVFKRLHAFTD